MKEQPRTENERSRKLQLSNTTALLFTGHNAFGPRLASVHFVAEHLVKRGINTGFVTVRLSLLSKMKSDGRYKFAQRRPFNQWLRTPQGLDAFTWLAPFHPINLHSWLANTAATPLYKLYPYLIPKLLLQRIKNTEIILIESGLPLLLTERLRRLAPHARFIYLSNDRLELLNVHPMIQEAERSQLSHFDLVRTLSEAQLADYSDHPNVHYISNGIDKNTFDTRHSNPYTKPRNIIVIGGMMFDGNVVRNLAIENPAYTFHLFGGEIKFPFSFPNVHLYGETPFADLVPYVQHADIGLAPYENRAGADYLSQSSLKLSQYTYCKLPIVAPYFTKSSFRPHICGYDPNCPKSQQHALNVAESYQRDSISGADVGTWGDVVENILAHSGIELPRNP